MRKRTVWNILFVIVCLFSFRFSLGQNIDNHCLKHQNIFAFFDLGDESDEESKNIYSSYSLVKLLLRDPCINVWLYSLLKKRWIRPLNEDDVHDFFENDVEIFSGHPIDINEFIKATSNFTKDEDVTLYYVHSRHTEELMTFPIIERLGYLQDVEKYKIERRYSGFTLEFCKSVSNSFS